MALIECPSCHKQVSDTCITCIHCGAELHHGAAAQVEQAPKEDKAFTKLPKTEQDALHKEFLKKYPKYDGLEERGMDYRKLLPLGGLELFPIIYILLFISFKVVDLENTEDSSMIILLIATILAVVLFLKSIVATIALRIAIHINEKHRLIALKRFQDWLKREKGIEYVIKFDTFTKRNKRYFDSIDLRIETY